MVYTIGESQMTTQQETQSIDSLIHDHEALANMSPEQLEALLDADSAQGDTASEEAPALADDKPAEGVATKDGKNIIPFAVLDATRQNLSKAEERANAADSARNEAEANLAELNARIEALESGSEAGNQAEVISNEELTELEAEMPELGKRLREQQEQINALNAKLATQSESNKANQAENMLNSVQLAIDATPKLAFLQTQDATAYEAAKRIDRTLRNDPEFADLSLSERFSKVIERYEETYGAIKLSTSAEIDIKKATEKALATADAKKTAPASMADIPGGTPPAVDEATAIEGKSGVELESMFAKMTPEQIDNLLNRL